MICTKNLGRVVRLKQYLFPTVFVMSQGASPLPAQDGPGLSAGTNDQTTHGSSQKESSHFEHPLSKRETPGGFAFEMSDTFLTPMAVVCPVTKVGAVKSKPLSWLYQKRHEANCRSTKSSMPAQWPQPASPSTQG